MRFYAGCAHYKIFLRARNEQKSNAVYTTSRASVFGKKTSLPVFEPSNCSHGFLEQILRASRIKEFTRIMFVKIPDDAMFKIFFKIVSLRSIRFAPASKLVSLFEERASGASSTESVRRQSEISLWIETRRPISRESRKMRLTRSGRKAAFERLFPRMDQPRPRWMYLVDLFGWSALRLHSPEGLCVWPLDR